MKFCPNKRRNCFDSLVLQRNVISSAPSTPDLKKKPYVPNFGYFSNCTSWSKQQYYFWLQTSDDKNMDSLEGSQGLKAAA